MINNIIVLKNFKFFTEFFFLINGILITVVYSVLKNRDTIKFEIHKPLGRCMALIFLMGAYLILNEFNYVFLYNKTNSTLLYSTISEDTLGIFLKFLLCIFASMFFYIIVEFLDDQEIKSEFLLILYFAIIGLLLLCVCNDLMSSYLAVELVSLSSYLLASFKKESSYSVEAGLKYFIMGSISSAFFLLGSSLIYACSGTIFFIELHHLFSKIEVETYLNSKFSPHLPQLPILPHISDSYPSEIEKYIFFENFRTEELISQKRRLISTTDCIDNTTGRYKSRSQLTDEQIFRIANAAVQAMENYECNRLGDHMAEFQEIEANLKFKDIKEKYYSTFSTAKLVKTAFPNIYKTSGFDLLKQTSSCSTIPKGLAECAKYKLINTNLSISELQKIEKAYLNFEFKDIKEKYYSAFPEDKLIKKAFPNFFNNINANDLNSLIKDPACNCILENIVQISKNKLVSINFNIHELREIEKAYLNFELKDLKEKYFSTFPKIFCITYPSKYFDMYKDNWYRFFKEPDCSFLVDGITNSVKRELINTNISISNLREIEKIYYLSLPKKKIISNFFFDNSSFKLIELGLLFILFSIFIKLALAPFHLWSLDVYEGSPTIATFFFSVMTKLSLFMFLIRFCYTAMPAFVIEWQFYSVWVAIISLFVGSFGGLKQRKLKTLLAYSSVNHMGYSLLVFSMGSFFGIKILIIYLLIYMLSGVCIWFSFLLLKLKKRKNKYSKELSDLSLLGKSNPALAFSLAITFFSIAGLPPFIGFITKIGVFLALLKEQFYFFCIIAVFCSVISTFYYIRIIKTMFFENVLVGKLYYPIKSNKIWLLSFITFLLLFIFINPKLLFLLVHLAIESK